MRREKNTRAFDAAQGRLPAARTAASLSSLPDLARLNRIPNFVHPSQILVTDSLSSDPDSAYTSQMGIAQAYRIIGIAFPIEEMGAPPYLARQL